MLKRAIRLAFAAGALLWFSATLNAAPQAAKGFASADDAVAALVQSLRTHDTASLGAILGPGSETLLNSGDRSADEEAQRRFVARFDEKHALVAAGDRRTVLEVGPDDWPMPIPIVETDGAWHFDSHEGAQEIVDRRIGRNEVSAIRVALTYVDAQRAFFDIEKASTGTGAYAQRLVSTPDHHDGLYWPVAEGEPPSPLGPLVAQALDEGYPGDIVDGKQTPYQGYKFRILKAQGRSAPGGAKSYIEGGRMTGGFALLAWPAIWGASGIMTFEVNQDGVVFQRNLGPETALLASRITRFDPDLSWARVDLADQ